MDQQPLRVPPFDKRHDTCRASMDDPTVMHKRPTPDANIPPGKLNNCRLHLQVTTLAKISDHTGTKLLDGIFLRGQEMPSLQDISKSLFQWPYQPNPSKQAWKLWTRMIQTLYTNPGLTNQLKQTLGTWNMSAAATRTWHTTYQPTTQDIFSSPPGKQPYQSSPTRTTRTHHVYYHRDNPTQSTHTNYPITTKTQRTGHRIALPVQPIPPSIPPNPEPQLPTLDLQIRQLLPKYASELWSNFSPAPATTEVNETLLNT